MREGLAVQALCAPMHHSKMHLTLSGIPIRAPENARHRGASMPSGSGSAQEVAGMRQNPELHPKYAWRCGARYSQAETQKTAARFPSGLKPLTAMATGHGEL